MNAEAAKACARTVIEAVWNRLSAHLEGNGPYITGPAVSAADFLATMLMRWSRNMPRPATQWPTLDRYVERMKARPSFRLLYEREGLTEWD
jgi:glutathione S-transferase